jgi:hypothetical protein
MPNEPFLIIWCIGMLMCIARTYRQWAVWRKRGGFPLPTPEAILYEDQYASGRSLKNVLTTFGGARSWLHIVVTADEVLITLSHPLEFTAAAYDLEHRIRKTAIIGLKEVARAQDFFEKRWELEYEDERGRHQLQVKPYDPMKFVGAVTSGANIQCQSRRSHCS